MQISSVHQGQTIATAAKVVANTQHAEKECCGEKALEESRKQGANKNGTNTASVPEHHLDVLA